MYLKGVHSEADTAVWLPKERVLFSASGIVVDQINILRPFVTIPDILAAAKMLKALNPEHVVPGHGQPGTVKIFEDTEKYYALLLERVGKLMKEGKTLDQIKEEVKMPEYAQLGEPGPLPDQRRGGLQDADGEIEGSRRLSFDGSARTSRRLEARHSTCSVYGCGAEHNRRADARPATTRPSPIVRAAAPSSSPGWRRSSSRAAGSPRAAACRA